MERTVPAYCLLAICEQFAAAAPEFVRLSEIGRSREGRPLLLLTVTDFSTGDPKDKPGILIQSNIHCHELAGPLAALHTVQRLVENRDQDGILKNTVYYVLPRINPDYAERVIEHSGWIRSRRDDRDERPNTFHQEDVDGNGLILRIRQECPDGNLCIDPDNLQRMIPRRADSKPPFYRVFPEGTIHNWDGVTPFAECFFEGKYRDWNRNWNAFWNPQEWGAGAFPFSEPEVYCQATFMADHPNLFASIAYHNGLESVMVPPQGCSENELDPGDRKLLEKAGRLASKHFGFPFYFASRMEARSDMPLVLRGGNYLDFAYYTMGLISVLVELGTVENSSGLSTETILSQLPDKYDEAESMRNWQKMHPDRRKAWHDWKPFLHPQLGPVEIGDVDIPVLAVPDTEHLQKICENAYHFSVDLAKKATRMELNSPEVQEISPGIFRIRLEVFNHGETPDHVTNQMLKLPDKPEPYLEIASLDGAECLSLSQHRKPGHFKPWELRREEWFFRKKSGVKNASVIFKLHGGPAGTVSRAILF